MDLHKADQPPYAEKSWRIIGFLSKKGLVTNKDSPDYGLFRKAKILWERFCESCSCLTACPLLPG